MRLSKIAFAWKPEYKTANKHEFNFKVNLCQTGSFYADMQLAL